MVQSVSVRRRGMDDMSTEKILEIAMQPGILNLANVKLQQKHWRGPWCINRVVVLSKNGFVGTIPPLHRRTNSFVDFW